MDWSKVSVPIDAPSEDVSENFWVIILRTIHVEVVCDDRPRSTVKVLPTTPENVVPASKEILRQRETIASIRVSPPPRETR